MKKHVTMKEIPSTERPYEKCLTHGASALTDAELLAVIIRTGTPGLQSLELSREVLQLSKSHHGLLGLHHLTVNELTGIKGIGKVKAVQIKCIAELSVRISRTCLDDGKTFASPAGVAEYYMEVLRHKEREQLILAVLNTKNKLICDKMISKGTVNSSLVSPREVFIEALQQQAVNIIMVHNHPSGDPTPSREDVQITERIRAAGEMLGIRLLDHIVIGDNCYVSFKERAIL